MYLKQTDKYYVVKIRENNSLIECVCKIFKITI